MKILDAIDIKEIATIFASVEVGSAMQKEDPMSAPIVMENAIYTLVYAFLKKKNLMVNGETGRYYTMAIIQSIIAAGGAQFLTKLSGEENGGLKFKEIIKDGLIKYVEVILGTAVRDTFIGDDLSDYNPLE